MESREASPLSDRLETLESIFSRLGDLGRIAEFTATHRDLAKRAARRDSTSLGQRIDDMVAENPGMSYQQATDRIEREDVELNALIPDQQDQIRGVDMYFANLGARISRMERRGKELEENLERVRMDIEVRTNMRFARVQEFIDEFKRIKEMVDLRVSNAENRMEAVEDEARRVLLFSAPPGHHNSGQRKEGRSALDNLPFPAKIAKLDVMVGDMHDEMQRIDTCVNTLQAPISRHDQKVGSLEVKTHTMSVRLDGVEAACKDIKQHLAVLSKPSKDKGTRIWHVGRRPAAPVMEDAAVPQDENQLPMRVKDLEDTLMQLDRRFAGFIAELNGFPLLEIPC